jgi:hypothetical protein
VIDGWMAGLVCVGRGAGSGARVQVQRQGHHRLLRGGDGGAPGRGAEAGDRIQHGRGRFQGLRG